MQNKEQENTEVFEGKEETAQKKKKLKIDKKHIQGFIAGILVSAIVFTGLLTGFNPGFLTGTTRNQGDIICDISQGDVSILQGKDSCLISYYDPNFGHSERRVGTADLSDTQITIKGSTSKYSIDVLYLDYVVDTWNDAFINIVLDGVNINGSLTALVLHEGASVNLTIKNENNLIAYKDMPGVIILSNSQLNISGPGSLITNRGSENYSYFRYGIASYDYNKVKVIR